MKTRPLLLAAALAFWGWQSQQLVVAVCLALAAESPRIIPARVTFAQKDLNRISDLCAFIVMLLAGYFFLTDRTVNAMFLTVQWLPAAFAPLMLAQVFNSADRINASGFFMVIRRKYPDGRPSGPFINFAYPYIALCVLGASAANSGGWMFYLGFTGIAAAMLWQARPGRFAPALWLGVVLTAAACGYAGQIGLHNLQLLLEQKGVEWLANAEGGDRDPFRNNTAIGNVGRLKQSDRILFRVQVPPGTRLPLLLREATFNIYRDTAWYARKAPFKQALTPGDDGRQWILTPDSDCDHKITVRTHFTNGKGTLALPAGTVRLDDLPAAVVRQNRLGAIRAEGGSDLATYIVCFHGDRSTDSLPDADDLNIPEPELEGLQALIARWRLAGRAPEAVAKIVARRFSAEFSYSVLLEIDPDGNSPITDFLTRTHTGHCEYFGTATVLLFRALGIPARYMSGYSVHERDRWSQDLVVRSRHAHAWAQVFIEDKWVNLDTTPAAWPELESVGAGFWQPAGDLWAWVRDRFERWYYTEGESTGGQWPSTVWLALAVLLVSVVVLLRKRGVRPTHTKPEPTFTRPDRGLDSPFYQVETQLARWGSNRRRQEPMSTYLDRVSRSNPQYAERIEAAQGLLSGHYRLRFDPRNADFEEKKAFGRAVRHWLDGDANY